MAGPDSFLSEVSEEVRRDQLVQLLRRNAVWIGLGLVIIIGGAAALEWRKASERAAAEARGDALWAALQLEAPADRAAALTGIEMAAPDGDAMVRMQRAAALLADDQPAEAVEILQAVASDGAVSEPMRNVARLKIAGAGEGVVEDALRGEVLEPMLVDGHPMRAMALEQRAMIRLAAGDVTGASEDLEAIGNEGGAPRGLRDRAAQVLMMISPAGTVDNG